ncbi:membrane protein [Mycolicibacterium vaccae 95051]|nr:membrane protein [Mycolicibacterium vaccae 95051]
MQQMIDRASATTATEMVQNGTFERFARTGYIVSGLLHLTIGYLAIRIALGSGVGSADQSGALSAVAAQPGGIVALWTATLAFLTMALWRLVETAVGRSTDPKSQRAASEVLDRAKAFALAVVYFALAYSTFGFARGSGKSSGEQSAGISARLMQTGAGTVALIAAGIVIFAVGAYHVYKGASQSFVDDLSGKSSDLVRRLGAVGYVVKGLAIAGAGILVIVAVSRTDPHSATGIDGALKALGAQPYGAVMLIVAGLGIITYGLYSFAMARYTKM